MNCPKTELALHVEYPAPKKMLSLPLHLPQLRRACFVSVWHSCCDIDLDRSLMPLCDQHGLRHQVRLGLIHNDSRCIIWHVKWQFKQCFLSYNNNIQARYKNVRVRGAVQSLVLDDTKSKMCCDCKRISGYFESSLVQPTTRDDWLMH